VRRCRRQNARNYTQCDSLLIGDRCGAHTFPYIEVRNPTGERRTRGHHVEDQRGPAVLLPAARHQPEDAVNMIVNGFCKEVFKELPMEFAVEAQNLLAVSLEGSVG
jgi:Fe-S cluster assembly protein SufB